MRNTSESQTKRYKIISSLLHFHNYVQSMCLLFVFLSSCSTHLLVINSPVCLSTSEAAAEALKQLCKSNNTLKVLLFDWMASNCDDVSIQNKKSIHSLTGSTAAPLKVSGIGLNQVTDVHVKWISNPRATECVCVVCGVVWCVVCGSRLQCLASTAGGGILVRRSLRDRARQRRLAVVTNHEAGHWLARNFRQNVRANHCWNLQITDM